MRKIFFLLIIAVLISGCAMIGDHARGGRTKIDYFAEQQLSFVNYSKNQHCPVSKLHDMSG